MIRQKITYTLLVLLMVTTSALAQSRSRTTITENVNATKAGLVHVLNRTGDTIILKSSTQIFRFSFLFHSQKESVLMDLGSKEARIPLHHFEVGRYTVVAYREDAVYPISLNRIESIAKPTNAIADLEEDVLRASLPAEELLKRNIKPRGYKKDDTRLASANSKPSRAEKEAKERAERERIQREGDAKAKKERAVAEVKERELKERLKKEAADKSRKEHALAEANRAKAAKDKADKQLAQIEANRQAIKDREIAEAKREKQRALALADAERKKQERDVAEHNSDRSSDPIEVKEVKYNISDINNGGLDKQTREEYRKENLRPNGKKYDE